MVKVDYRTIVRTAEDLQHSNPSVSLRVAELAERFGVSERLIYLAFKTETGAPPATWLRRLRLSRVRGILQNEESGTTLVKTVALNHGFRHLGSFSAAYKERFGELPSETLSARCDS